MCISCETCFLFTIFSAVRIKERTVLQHCVCYWWNQIPCLCIHFGWTWMFSLGFRKIVLWGICLSKLHKSNQIFLLKKNLSLHLIKKHTNSVFSFNKFDSPLMETICFCFFQDRFHWNCDTPPAFSVNNCPLWLNEKTGNACQETSKNVESMRHRKDYNNP